MMDEIVFTHIRCPPGHICFDHREAKKGIARIHIPEDFDHVRQLFNDWGLGPWIPNREKYRTYDEYAEDSMESSITHETIHFLLFTMESKKASDGLDYFDHTEEGYRCFE